MRAPRAATCLWPGLLGESQQVGLGAQPMFGRNLDEDIGDHVDHRVAQPPRPGSNAGRGRQGGDRAAIEVPPGIHQASAFHHPLRCRLRHITEMLQKPCRRTISEGLHYSALLDFHQQGTKFGFGRPHTREQLTDAVGKSRRVG
nr:hypothetical protein [Amycolatopsis tolypomycina]